MTSQLRTERTLTLLLEDLYAAPLSPDYRTEVHAAVRRTRQRPAWTFLERWIPMADITTRLAPVPRLPARAGLVALLILALAAAAILYVAGHSSVRPAPPFGLADNGGVVYALGGDIYVGDAKTGTSHAITTGAAFDRNPLVSPDGTRVAFLRTSADSTEDSFDLLVANIDGSAARVISTAKVADGDPGFWSPDSTFLVMMGADEAMYRYDVGGAAPVLIAEHAMPRVFLPPTGAQLVYEEMDGSARALGVMNADGTDRHLIYTIPAMETRDGCDLGGVLASPDGSAVTFTRRPVGTADQCRLFIVNIDGSNAHQLSTDPNLVFETDARWSPDGSMIAFDRWNGDTPGQWNIQPIGVIPAGGGATRAIGPTPVGDGAAFEWSPDGRSIISVAGTVTGWPPSTTLPDAHPTIIDVATGEFHEASWSMSSWPTWQRVGPPPRS